MHAETGPDNGVNTPMPTRSHVNRGTGKCTYTYTVVHDMHKLDLTVKRDQTTREKSAHRENRLRILFRSHTAEHTIYYVEPPLLLHYIIIYFLIHCSPRVPNSHYTHCLTAGQYVITYNILR